MKKLFWNLLVLLSIPLLIAFAIISKRNKKYFIWGSTPILNNKYWSAALKEIGFQSLTIMQGYYSINKKDDFDLYFEDFISWKLPKVVRIGLGRIKSLIFVLRNARVVHTSFDGFSLGDTLFWKVESVLFRIANVKTIILPFGADGYLYSKIFDTSLRNGLLASYPNFAKEEVTIESRVKHWIQKADIVIPGIMVDGIGRWDVTMNQIFSIDLKEWVSKTNYSNHDGENGTVKILHTPNHRGFKGTEFLLEAVKELKRSGLLVELVLIEKQPNSRVKELMHEVDILAEQFIAPMYALSGIEGMASGLPVLANLENEIYTRVFRRYSFLNECPILSTSPENIYQNLKVLIKNPSLRKALGLAGREYVTKYHSYETAQYLFGAIYDKILYNKEVDLINLFHPIKSRYSKSKPFVQHPLIENKLPKEYSYT